jgi:uncharacterized protein (TIGR02270 family)
MTVPIVLAIVLQHVDDAVTLHGSRTMLATAPQGALRYLRRFDDRLAAHLDGISVAGRRGQALLDAAMDPVSAGSVFVSTIVGIRESQERLNLLISLAEATPGAWTGFFSAFGWVERPELQGTVATLLTAREPFRRLTGIAACGLHRVDPGLMSSGRPDDPDSLVRARLLRTVGEVGVLQAQRLCSEALTDSDPVSQFWAAWSAVLLGDRQRALDALTQIGVTDNSHRARAFRLALQALTPAAAHAALQSLGGDPAQIRWLLQGSGINGDPTYAPWLIKHMADDTTSRLAGEAFSLITGTDLALLDLERKPPENFESGPNDNPEDTNVEMDPDDGLPWPDPEKIEDWWATNSSRFQPGQRYFVGAPVTRAHCIDVLKNGYQRQRILAAHYLCLLNPGTPLFNTSAPAWRQQKLLAEMT